MNTIPALRSEAIKTVIMSADYLILPTPAASIDLRTLIGTVHTMVVPPKTAHLILCH